LRSLTIVTILAIAALLGIQYWMIAGNSKTTIGAGSSDYLSKAKIRESYQQQNTISWQVSSYFRDYESAIFDYLKKPNKTNQDAMNIQLDVC